MNKKIIYPILGIILLYGLLMIPVDPSIEIQSKANANPFIWNQDERWEQLEEQFNAARMDTGISRENTIQAKTASINQFLEELENSPFFPEDTRLDSLLNEFFELGPLVAAYGESNQDFVELYNRSRRIIKNESVDWDINRDETRIALYKTLYGMRAAVEEVLLQSEVEIDPVLHVQNEGSVTPSTEILGIKVHSGDLLVSRGGAEVSALISRGNDFPGNFSHVALIYVEEETNEPYLIEAHIERGVAIATAEEYINDRKLRFMVLRVRSNLPEIKEDPLLPHKAAKFMFEEAQKRHIPYDFKMNFFEPEAMFCSEVGSYAYKEYGIQLWQSESTISSYGVVTLLNTFGVENFVTQMPSDLEYDPQLAVVAEWRDTKALFEDHLYNAVIDAMLVCAENGEEIDYNEWLLPVVRLAKGYSYLMNLIGKTGPVPEGMSSMQAAKSEAFVNRHETLKEKVRTKAAVFSETQDYTPPYWELVRMAEEATGCK
ncbi:MAG TPA: YiiX/YebB-like N1pC/P60 family cysteine hydrolase [Gracilimonas sp.]|uniref:YiiX/YebB-like N1pC/P60 family cysteine hydrolase n=1 Tax=Gracilimonas sp. TaxID=1974203 RepID=UPI002DAFE3FF|nr:YiiX/YebB-like N1pC/P60 family cysteine hydrolase [Gracilimonas sp.]